MTGSAIAAEIAGAYSEAGQAVGDGQGAVTLTLKRRTPTGEDSHDFTARPVSLAQAQRAGLTVAEGERVYSLVNHGVSVEPTVADKLVIDGKSWSIAQVIAKDPAGYVLTWMVKVKG